MVFDLNQLDARGWLGLTVSTLNYRVLQAFERASTWEQRNLAWHSLMLLGVREWLNGQSLNIGSWETLQPNNDASRSLQLYAERLFDTVTRFSSDPTTAWQVLFRHFGFVKRIKRMFMEEERSSSHVVLPKEEYDLLLTMITYHWSRRPTAEDWMRTAAAAADALIAVGQHDAAAALLHRAYARHDLEITGDVKIIWPEYMAASLTV